MDIKKVQSQMLRGFAWQGSAKLVVQILSWFSTIYVARILSPTDYGIMAIAGVFLAIFFSLSELGLAEGLITAKKVSPRSRDSVLYLGLGLAGTLYAIVWLLADTAAEIYDTPELVGIIRLGALGMIVSAIKAVPFALTMRDLDYRYRSITEMLATLAQTVSVILLAIAGHGYWSLVWSYLIRQLVMTLLFLPKYQARPALHFSWSDTRSICSYGAKLTLERILALIIDKIPIAIIGRLLGSRVLGHYDMGYQLASMPIDKVGSVFSQVSFPAIARVARDSANEAGGLFVGTHRYLMLITMPMLLGLAVTAKGLILVLITEKWAATVPILQVFCVVNILRLSAISMNPVLLGIGRADLLLRIRFGSAILFPPVLLVGIRYGINGVLIAYAVLNVLVFAATLAMSLRAANLRAIDYWRTWKTPLFGSMAMLLVAVLLQTYAVDSTTAVGLVATIILSATSYIGAVALIDRSLLIEMKSHIRRVIETKT